MKSGTLFGGTAHNEDYNSSGCIKGILFGAETPISGS